jgi:hypothetical protein
LLEAVASLGGSFPLTWELNVSSWDREAVKIALGLSCLAFGDEFVASSQAELLRSFLFEDDIEKRSVIPIKGAMSFKSGTKKIIPDNLVPGPSYHLYVILDTKCSIIFIGKIFGNEEMLVEVDPERGFANSFPGGPDVDGVCWIVDAVNKTTEGPIRWPKYIAQRVEDLNDIAILEQRQKEPSRSLDEYLADQRKKRT